MNTVSDVLDGVNTLVTSSIERHGFEIDYGNLMKGELNGWTIYSKRLDLIPGVENIRPAEVGDTFYEVCIETNTTQPELDIIGVYSAQRSTALSVGTVIARKLNKEVRYTYMSAILGWMNSDGGMTKYDRYDRIYPGEDIDIANYLDFINV
jgi:hypothetical protein